MASFTNPDLSLSNTLGLYSTNGCSSYYSYTRFLLLVASPQAQLVDILFVIAAVGSLLVGSLEAGAVVARAVKS